MGHDHSHHHGFGPDELGDRKVRRALTGALAVTAGFMFVEFAGGWLANSLALLSDAAHMLTDVGGLLLSLFAFWISRRPSTPTLSFGYGRAEIIGALFSGLLIWLLAGLLVFESYHRLQDPPEVKGLMVLVIATIGLVVNLVSMAFLHKARAQNLNVRGAYLHVLGDLLGSVGAMASGAVMLWTGWWLVDPIVTLVIAAIVLYSSGRLVWEAVGILLESVPKGVSHQKIQRDLESIAGVEEVHDLHVWSVGSGKAALSVHLISKDGDRVLNEADSVLRERHGIAHTTIQVEHPDRFNRANCIDCADPEFH